MRGSSRKATTPEEERATAIRNASVQRAAHSRPRKTKEDGSAVQPSTPTARCEVVPGRCPRRGLQPLQRSPPIKLKRWSPMHISEEAISSRVPASFVQPPALAERLESRQPCRQEALWTSADSLDPLVQAWGKTNS